MTSMMSITSPESASIHAEIEHVAARMSLVPPVPAMRGVRERLNAKRLTLEQKARQVEDRAAVLY